MSQMPESPATARIPVQLSEPEFIAFIFPHLSMPRRGPKCKLGYHRVFNLILWVLYTGMQWKCLPVPEAGDGTAVIHYTTVYKVFAKWSDDGSLRKRRSQKARSSPVRRKWPLENGRFRRPSALSGTDPFPLGVADPSSAQVFVFDRRRGRAHFNQ